MEGLNLGLELDPGLNKPEEIKEELERLRRRKEEEKAFAHSQPACTILTSLSIPQYLDGDGIMIGTVMSSKVKSQLSKCNTIAIDGKLAVAGNSGSGTASAVFLHQISPVSSIKFMASAGLREVISVHASRHLSCHSTATTGVAISLRDGSINLSNTWTHQLSEASEGNIQLVLGPESVISVGWQKEDEKNSASGELKFGTSSIGVSGHYTRHFSAISQGRIASRIKSTAIEFEIGVGRRISDFSSVGMVYKIGLQGVSWRFELHQGGQGLIIPILLFSELNALVAAGAFPIPSSLYFLLKIYVGKPFYLRRE